MKAQLARHSASRGFQTRSAINTGLPALSCALLLACAATPTPPSAPPVADERNITTAVFVCDAPDGTLTFTTKALAGELAVWLPMAFQRPYLVLQQTRAASGVRYAADGVVVWQHGDEAMLEMDSLRYSGCRRDPRASIWEHAKLEGVDFRGTGNEPGWVLEIRDKNRIDLRYNYGSSRIQAVADHVVDDQVARRTTYAVIASEPPRLAIEITAESCSDDMSGEQFPASVVVRIGDRVLRGCGRPLH